LREKEHRQRVRRHVDHSKTPQVGNEDDLYRILDGLSVPPFLLILDQVQDPHNLGACLRSADAVGAHALIMPKDRSVTITDTVRNVASGAAENLPVIQVTNLARTMDELNPGDESGPDDG
jgi:23S rRNA (guanosine2251-2'-O)-methyltransferase